VNTVMHSVGKFFSGRVTGGFSRRTQLQGVRGHHRLRVSLKLSAALRYSCSFRGLFFDPEDG
jgi:hypothetical protein